MFGISIACLVVGFAATVYACARYVPPLAARREGAIATWFVRVLMGSAVAWAALQTYCAIYSFAHVDATAGRFPPVIGVTRIQILDATVATILPLSGLLAAGAAIIYLLSPTDEPVDQRS